MNDAAADKPTTAGGLLRRARQAQGLHIAALAASIKVTQRKLEALEGDRYDELPDATFTRALAQTVCRSLKVDPAPVLALLPQNRTHRLEHLGEGINAPFRERPGSLAPNEWANLSRPAVLAPLILLLAALAVYLLPPGWLSLPSVGGEAASQPGGAPPTVVAETVVPAVPAAEVAASATAMAAEPPASALVETVHAAPQEALPAASEPGPAAVGGSLQLRATAESWIEVLDGRGQPLLARTVLPGETLGLDGLMPLKLKIGNAAVTQVTFRGQPVALGAYTRDNIARLELK